MLNPATNVARNDFNKFTRMLKKKLLAGERVFVELRDGRIVELEWFVGKGFDEGIEYFQSKQNGYILAWNNDGTSITNEMNDIMRDVE